MLLNPEGFIPADVAYRTEMARRAYPPGRPPVERTLRRHRLLDALRHAVRPAASA